MVVDFWKVIYSFYLRTTSNKGMAKHQSIGVVSAIQLFILNFLVSLIFYLQNIKLSSIGGSKFILINLFTFWGLIFMNYIYFKNNHTKITEAFTKGNIFKYGVLFFGIASLTLGLVAAILYKKANGF